MKFLQSSAIALLLAATAAAQPAADIMQTGEAKPRPAIGGFGGVNVNMAHANFSQLPGVPDCNALYTSGSGIGPTLGVFYEIPLQNSFSLALRAVYNSYGEKLTSDEQAPIAVDGVETAGVIEHSIKATLGMIGLQPLVNYHITPAFSVHFGGEIGLVMQSSFTQIETLTQPSTSGVFSNGLRARNPQSGAIPDASTIVASLIGGVSYSFPLNAANSLQAVPELTYVLGLTTVEKNLSWSVSSLRGAIAIRFEIPEKPVEIPKPPPPDTIPPPPPPVAPPIVAIEARGVDKNGEESPSAIMRVEEIYTVQMTPTLPYVFFDEHSSALPARYDRIAAGTTDKFDEDLLKHSDGLAINHHILNVIGRRLTNHPETSITLSGITLGRTKSAIDKKLALERANAVADYLKNIWNIPANRMRITTRPLGEETVVALDSDGVAEANRVEIASNTFAILQPVMGSDTLRSVTPPTIRFRPTLNYTEQVTDWDIHVTQEGRELKSFHGTSNPPAKLDWVLSDDQKAIPKFPGKIEYSFNVTGSHNDHGGAQRTMPVEQVSLRKKKLERMADKEVEKYNLLLFGLQSSELNETNKQIIDLIPKHLKSSSTVTITGHTDRTGDVELNKRLSLERARSTAKALGITNADVRGIANETILYDNNLPEGRCLSRTVDIVIETPTETQ
ncbi:MAG: OmpA family protein [Bacteroidota bacterium]|nr:OmpA family protein [Bacteroidota bacterium]